MAYTRYTDNGDGSFTFYDDATGASTMATGPGARTRAMDIDAVDAMAAPSLPAPDLLAAPAMPAPPPMPTLGERGALAISPEQAQADMAALKKMGGGIGDILNAFGRGARNFLGSSQTADVPPSLAIESEPLAGPGAKPIFSPGVKEAAKGLVTGRPLETMTGDQPTSDTSALGGTPPAPATAPIAPAEGAPAIVRTGIGAQPQAPPTPPAKPEMVTAGVSTSTATGSTRALGPSKETLDAAMKAQAELGQAQADLAQRQADAQLAQARYIREQAQAEEKARMDQAIVEEETQRRLAPVNQAIDTARQQYQSMSVDPNRWWNSRTTEQRNSATLALFLGAVGAGITGGQNVAIKDIDDNIKRDIDAQLANIDKKRGELTELQRVAQTVRQQGGDIQAQKNAMLATARGAMALRIDAMGKTMAAGYSPNQLDERGNPLPGTPAATAMLAAKEMAAKSAQQRMEISAQQRGTVTSETKKVEEKRPLETGQAPDWMANAPFVQDTDRDGNVRTYAIQNVKGVDPKKITEQHSALQTGISEAKRARDKLQTFAGRTWDKDAARAMLESVAGIKSVVIGQGAMTASEQEKFDKKFEGVTSLASALSTLQAYEDFMYEKKQRNLDQAHVKVVPRDVAEAAMQRGLAKPQKKD